MCLFSQRGVPFTAQRDIKVIKAVKKNDNGSFVTPYQGMAAVPGSTMMAEGEKECWSYNSLKYMIRAGYIHSEIIGNMEYYNDMYGIVAYIPKGTKYYIDQCIDDVCSEELMLTNDMMTGIKLIKYDFRNEIALPIVRDLLETVSRTTVSPGWVILSDRTFIHPLDYDNNMTAIGVVCAIRDGRALITALDSAHLKWCHGGIELDSKPITGRNAALNDMNGREYTKRIVNSDTYKNDDTSYAAVRYCAEYETEGAEKGEWYLPSTGELAFMYFYDLDIINATLMLLDKEIIFNTFYWASAEYSNANALGCYVNFADINYYLKWVSCYVRPSFSLPIED